MKQMLFLVLIISLLLVGCRGKVADGKSEIASDVTEIQEVLGGKERFDAADEDFVATSFEDRAFEERGVYFMRDGFGEFGAFLLPSAAEAAAFEGTVRAYLAREAEAIRSLAALYPAEELEARLACFDEASVVRRGAAVYYFALPREDTSRAMRVVTGDS